ncbi:MAG: hypothetical protein HQ567_17385 [Candidatus Nealsonbacteria bacterium]|nr:hypothetical protein [Candidatus Nealsonbacteria bacterium]
MNIYLSQLREKPPASSTLATYFCPTSKTTQGAEWTSSTAPPIFVLPIENRHEDTSPPHPANAERV